MLVRRLLDKSNTSSNAMFPMEGGIVALSSLPDRFNILSDWKLTRSSGVDPVKPIFWLDKSSSWRVNIDSGKLGS